MSSYVKCNKCICKKCTQYKCKFNCKDKSTTYKLKCDLNLKHCIYLKSDMMEKSLL